MQHLELEELARLVDEAPSAAEADHLAVCEECRAELEAFRGQTSALAELPPLTPPPAAWVALEARLQAEGLLRREPVFGRWRVAALQAAAALALFVGGAAAGAAWRGAEVGPAAVPAGSAVVRSLSALEAEQAVHDAETAYLAALTRYAELTDTQQSDDPATRLAALEGIVLTTRAALEQAPADPVINGYHLAALGQQQAMLRRLAETSSDRRWY